MFQRSRAHASHDTGYTVLIRHDDKAATGLFSSLKTQVALYSWLFKEIRRSVAFEQNRFLHCGSRWQTEGTDFHACS